MPTAIVTPDTPRSRILDGPTPLVLAPNLSRRLGIELWIKRDDVAGPTMGGNKSRQLEYYFGAAEEAGADTILITGAVQSNFVRTAACIARARGMHPIVQLEERVPGMDEVYHTSGNVVLSKLLGAEILHYPEGEDEAGADAALYAHADTLRAQGRVPYVIPLGEAHPPLGALGYVQAAGEILAQQGDFDVVVVASGSGATHSGLLAGLRAGGSSAVVIGSCVRRDATAQTARMERVLGRLATLWPPAGSVVADDLTLWDGALAPGYGQPGPAAQAAMHLMAEAEGLFLDPVYTAKTFAAVTALTQAGAIPEGARVCFVHTGGLASLFAYPVG